MRKYFTLFILLFFAATRFTFTQTVVINEFMASNTTIPDPAGQFDD